MTLPLSRTLALALLLGACTHNVAPVVRPSTLPAARSLSPRRIRLLLPQDFTTYVQASSFENREMRFAFGAGAAPALDSALRQRFARVESQAAGGSVAVALATDLSKNGGASVDYVVVPSFVNSSSAVKPGRFGVQMGIRLEFVSADRTSVRMVEGVGRADAHLYTNAALQRAGERALGNALAQLLTRLDAQRDSLAP